MATYVKSLAKRACFSEGSTKAVEAYKAEFASLTSERANLRAQVRHLTVDTVKYKSDLKHPQRRNHELKNMKRRLRMS